MNLTKEVSLPRFLPENSDPLHLVEELIVVCAGCKQRIKKKRMQEHLTQCAVPCEMGCNQRVPPAERHSHHLICPRALIACAAADVGCPFEGPREQVYAHSEYCKYEQQREILSRLIKLEKSYKQLQKEHSELMESHTALQADHQILKRSIQLGLCDEAGFLPKAIHINTGTPYAPSGLDIRGFDEKGHNRQGFDAEGYNHAGFGKDGYNREGFNRAGVDRDGYDKEGFNRDGFDREGYNREGFNRRGLDRQGHDRTRRSSKA
eukprot:gnl/Spiro4/27467_TR13664_c0_g1_i1.p1 gnl/Spiro4/27467_TR13664_c0_g1~~gnl/Spiro4/27467_TR13664_c0_g1_i1.p1  ORF type:complete len:300 (+),score=63.46 gnl/Spiro4/27467_TR13664_c0_g1_i1:112-900(+)